MTWVGRDQYLFSKAGEFEIGQEGIARYTQFDRGGARGVLSAECQNSVPCPTTAGSAIQQPTPASRRSTSCARWSDRLPANASVVVWSIGRIVDRPPLSWLEGTLFRIYVRARLPPYLGRL